jgi:hypothetical protein
MLVYIGKKLSSVDWMNHSQIIVYFGGLNTAYQIGKFKNDDCIILDLSIKGAYGAALAMIPAVH